MGKSAAAVKAVEFDPVKEAAALEALLADFRDMIAEDPDLALDLAESETNAMEIIDALIVADGLDAELIKGAKEAKSVIDTRMKRFETRAERRRAIIERFMLILEQKKLERPAATLSLANRPLRVEIVDESAIPTEFFVTPAPVIDKKRLNERVAQIMAEREAELAAAKSEQREPALPPLPDGVAIGNGGVGLTVRRR